MTSRSLRWSPIFLAAFLSPALLQPVSCQSGNANLSSLSIESAGLDRVQSFSSSVSRYDVWTHDPTEIWVVSADAATPTARVNYTLTKAGETESGFLGSGGGSVTLMVPLGALGSLRLDVSDRSAFRSYTVNINPNCSPGECEDMNSCTTDACVGTRCEFTELSDGDACVDETPASGVCTGGWCNAAPLTELAPIANPSDPCDSLSGALLLECKLFEASQLGAFPRMLDQAEASQLAQAITDILLVLDDAIEQSMSQAEFDALISAQNDTCITLSGGLTCLNVYTAEVDWPDSIERPEITPLATFATKALPDPDGDIDIGPWDSETCWGRDPSIPLDDNDGDGLDDRCEYELASRFRPNLQFSLGDADTARRPYWAAFPDHTSPDDSVWIFYALSYLRDSGCDSSFDWCLPHDGDSEFVVADVRSLRADGKATKWRLQRMYLSSHFGHLNSNSDWFLGLGWRSRVWVALGKHANYPDRDSCNEPGFNKDTCLCADFDPVTCPSPSPPSVLLQVKRERNLGSRTCRFVDTPVQADRNGEDCGITGSGLECQDEQYWDEAPFCGWQRDGERCPGGKNSYMKQLEYFKGTAPTTCDERCTGGVDEDEDGDIDCMDSDCSAAPACAGGGTTSFLDILASDPTSDSRATVSALEYTVSCDDDSEVQGALVPTPLSSPPDDPEWTAAAVEVGQGTCELTLLGELGLCFGGPLVFTAPPASLTTIDVPLHCDCGVEGRLCEAEFGQAGECINDFCTPFCDRCDGMSGGSCTTLHGHPGRCVGTLCEREETCDPADGDGDGDGLLGCADPDCFTNPECTNLCPELSVLSCGPVFGVTSGAPDIAGVLCELDFFDPDKSCDESCDPETCAIDPQTGTLNCEPAPDPGLSTTVTCSPANTSGTFPSIIACGGDAILGTSQPSCVIDPLGLGSRGDVGSPQSFAVACLSSQFDGTDFVSCTVTTTDGDDDCTQSRNVFIDCPSSLPSGGCESQAHCDDRDPCTTDLCDPTNGFCTHASATAGTPCTTFFGGPGFCEGSFCRTVCDALDCDDGNECTLDECDLFVGCVNRLGLASCACSSAVGSGVGTCGADGTCAPADECSNNDDCTCTGGLCDRAAAPWTCLCP